jgi:hypothetical protein
MFGLALGPANSQPVNAQGWLANSHRYALPVLSAYANAGVQLQVVADH